MKLVGWSLRQWLTRRRSDLKSSPLRSGGLKLIAGFVLFMCLLPWGIIGIWLTVNIFRN